MRIGIGFDVHALVEGRKLVLGGVTLPHPLGLLGHSDADVLIHALMDALLGAAGLGDIGRHFPDSDDAYRGISSLVLLRRVGAMLEERGFKVENIDAVIIAQKPKMIPFIPQMEENIAASLGISRERINVKATTTEGLGFAGREEGIGAQVVCLLTRVNG
jgi:2-C-methyl-D-erythritol 2,4-cyclodiphosphate synthase